VERWIVGIHCEENKFHVHGSCCRFQIWERTGVENKCLVTIRELAQNFL
jgi:hypothetical protein